MKTQISKQHTNVVAVQPLITFHKEDRMKNACPTLFASQGTRPHLKSSQGASIHRFSTIVAIGMLLLGSICSAQQTSVQSDQAAGRSENALSLAGNQGDSASPGPLTVTQGYIPYFVNGQGYTDSIMSQVTGGIAVNNGYFNLTNLANNYRIAGKVVLAVGDNPNGTRNLSVGVGAGRADASGGNSNTMVGASAGGSNGPNSSFNVFVGGATGATNTTGGYNTCVGVGACNLGNATGNTEIGVFSGFYTTGGFNTFLGQGAGNNNTTGDSNLYLGNPGPTTQENNTIRIGNQGSGIGTSKQNNTYIAGIYGNNPGGNVYPVCIDSLGHLYQAPTGAFCSPSSRRFKDQISDMGDSSSKLFQLHPVTFFYKPESDDGSHALQYGLIAEEVAKVYPEMVAYEKDGQPYTVRYQLLAPLMLNELQKQHKLVAAQQSELQTQLQQISAQRQEIDDLKLQLQQRNASLQERLSKLELYVATQMKTASDNPPRTTPVTNGGLQ